MSAQKKSRALHLLAGGAVAIGLILAGCTPEPAQVRRTDAGGAPEPAVRKLVITRAPGGDAARVIKSAAAQAEADHRRLLVYIGAVWCEPCQRFHRAAERGELDSHFPDVTLLEFDLDADGSRLTPAGYHPPFIPYFGVPDDSGRATSAGMSGSIKGDGAVENIVPRLNELLGRK